MRQADKFPNGPVNLDFNSMRIEPLDCLPANILSIILVV